MWNPFRRRESEPEPESGARTIDPVEIGAMAQSGLTYTQGLQDALGRGVEFVDGSVTTFDGFARTYSELYRKQSALRGVIDFLARNVAQIGLKLYLREEDASLPQPKHPAQRALKHPSTGVSYSRFMRQVIGDLLLFDCAFIWKIRFSDHIELVRIPIPSLVIKTGTFFAPTEFGIGTGWTQETVKEPDFMWIHGYSPVTNAAGISPAETLRQILAEEYAAGQDRQREWRNGAKLKGALERSVDMDDAGNAEIKRWHEEWKQNSTGDKGAYGTPMLPPGVTMNWGKFDTSEQMQYLGTRKLAREEVAREYGVPLPVLGLMDTSNWSTDQYHQMLYQDTFGPIITFVQEEFEEQLLYADYEDVDSDFFYEFDINQKMKGSFLDQAAIGQKAVGGPWMTRNEFRTKYQNLPPIPGGDDIVVPTNVLIGGGPQANPSDAQNQHGADMGRLPASANGHGAVDLADLGELT